MYIGAARGPRARGSWGGRARGRWLCGRATLNVHRAIAVCLDYDDCDRI